MPPTLAFHLKDRPVGQLAFEYFQDLSIVQPQRFVKRDRESSSNKCTKNDKSALCGKPSETNNVTLPVVLGIVYESIHRMFNNSNANLLLAYLWVLL